MNTNRGKCFRIGRWLLGLFLMAVALLAAYMWWVVAGAIMTRMKK